ncbi:MAG: transcriptional regulator [Candidatus Nanohaloarchaea archaeon]
MDWDKYSFVVASEYRTDIILQLFSGEPLTPKQISERTDYRLTHVSNTLSDLKGKELVRCITEDRNKGRLYQLTDEGRKIAEKLEN